MHLIWLGEPKHKLSLEADCTHAKGKEKGHKSPGKKCDNILTGLALFLFGLSSLVTLESDNAKSLCGPLMAPASL